MSSQLPSPLDARPSTPPSNDEVLVRVEGVSKKFCRSLKKSLWYGVCDIASELNPFGRTAAFANPHKNLTTEDTESTEGNTGVNQLADSAEFLEGHSQAGLQMDSEKPASIRSANAPSAFGEQTGPDSESVLIHDIRGKKESIATDGAGLRDGEFFAVKDVSFELRRGECLGLIGHNGAGKTTLLKMLNGLIKPDAGSITMRGRVGALIALGAGFNPILTGRENIYINGSVLGLSKKEIDAKIDEIIDFAEIREAIDMPVQNYSSGMAVRLGFSIASSLSPDVLILDEVLAVGDVGFRTKCYNRIFQLCKTAAVIFVSHSMSQIDRLCNRAIVLKGGVITFHGNIGTAIDQYYQVFPKSNQNVQIADGVIINSVSINGDSESTNFKINSDHSLKIVVIGRLPARVKRIEAIISILNPSMDLSSQASNRYSGENIYNHNSYMHLKIILQGVLLGSGRKLLSLSLVDADTNEILYWAHAHWVANIVNPLFIPAPVHYSASYQMLKY